MSPRWPRFVAGPGRYRLRLAAWVLSLSLVSFAVGQAGSPIDKDDEVILFPTAAAFDPDSKEWVLPIHGWVFEPEENSIKRGFLLDMFRRSLGLDRDQAEAALFRSRARPFLFDNERGKLVSVRIGEQEFEVGTSGANGHFHGTVRLSELDVVTRQRAQLEYRIANERVDRARPSGGLRSETDDCLDFQAVLRDGDERTFSGRVHLINGSGYSVISDIDDTIKITEIPKGKTVLLRRTFLQEFEAVPGMAQAYRKWQGQGAAFHYVSAGPWQLFPALGDFLATAKYPSGSFHMKVVRAKDTTFLDLFAAADEVKLAAIEPLLKAAPRRRFILVGDSGERDPEIYGEVARRYPEQVAAIFIHDVTSEDDSALRYRDAFRGYPAEQWQTFRDAKDLETFDLTPVPPP